jgi:hypothetical protein
MGWHVYWMGLLKCHAVFRSHAISELVENVQHFRSSICWCTSITKDLQHTRAVACPPSSESHVEQVGLVSGIIGGRAGGGFRVRVRVS